MYCDDDRPDSSSLSHTIPSHRADNNYDSDGEASVKNGSPTDNCRPSRIDDVEHWKKALLARDLDSLHTCALMIVTDISPSQQSQTAQTMLDSLQNIRNVIIPPQVKKETGEATPSRDNSTRQSFSTLLHLRNAVLARNLDLIQTCVHIILMNFSRGRQAQLGKTIVASLQDIENITMNCESPSENLVHCTEVQLGHSETDELEENGSNSMATPAPQHLPESPKPPSAPKSPGRPTSKIPTPSSSVYRIAMVNTGVCPICSRSIARGKCNACRVHAYKVREQCREGYIAKCDHKNYSGGYHCRVCRYHLYNLMNARGEWIAQ